MAQVKFSQLPNLGQVTGNTIFPVVQDNLNFTVTSNAIQAFALSGNAAMSLNGNITTTRFFNGDGSQLANLSNNIALSNFANNQSNTNSNVANVYASVVGIQANAVATNSNVANLVTAINATNSNVANTNSNVANLSTSVTGISSSISGFSASLTATNSNVANLTTTVNSAVANIAALQTSTTGITANVSSLTASLTNTNYNVAFNSSNITILQSNVASLSGQTYTNANVAAYLPAYGGNLQANNAVFLGNLQVNGTLTAVNSNTVTINDLAINVANNAVVASQANGGGLLIGPLGAEYAGLTYNSSSNALVTSGNLSITGYVYGNGAFLTGITAGTNYSNANVAAYLPTNTANVATGNLILSTAGRILGDFGNPTRANRVYFQSSDARFTNTAIIPGAGYVPASNTSTITAQTLHTSTDVGNSSGLSLVISNSLASLQSQSFGSGPLLPLTVSASTANLVLSGGNITLSTLNTFATGDISAAGNITGAAIKGSSLSVVGNITGSGLLAGFTGISTTGNIHGAFIQATGLSASGNIQIAGGTTVAYDISAAGNVSAGAQIIAPSLKLRSAEEGMGVGYNAGLSAQGNSAVAIGALAGVSAQGNNSIIINATGLNLNQTTANTFTVKPVRGDTTTNLVAAGFKGVYYNPTTGEFCYSTGA